MCLMCEYYLESCSHPACVDAARPSDRYRTRSGTALYLWRGAGRPACPDMVARHESSCACLTDDEAECDCPATA